MTTAIIVQARSTSTRLPNKVLLDLGGQTALFWCLSRCKRVASVEHVVCCVPYGAAHDAVAAEAVNAGAVVTRGPEQDVLARYLLAARAVGATEIMRVTSDCPLIDPGVCGRVLELRRATGADYACNNMPPSYPHGLDCEAFTLAALEDAAASARDPREREHVTPWLREQAGVTRANLQAPTSDYVSWRWTLDYPADSRFFCALVPLLKNIYVDWTEIVQVIQANPALMQINAEHRAR